MASMGGVYLDAEPLIRMVKSGGYVNRLLQQICTGEGVSKLGVKAELQNRIIESKFRVNFLSLASIRRRNWAIIPYTTDNSTSTGLQTHARNNDGPRFARLKQMIENPSSITTSGMASSSSSLAGTPVPPNQYHGASSSNGLGYGNGMGPTPGVFRPHGNPSTYSAQPKHCLWMLTCGRNRIQAQSVL